MSKFTRRSLVAGAPVVAGAALLPSVAGAAVGPLGAIELVTPFRLLDSRESEPDKYDGTARDSVAVPGITGKLGVILNVTVAQTEGRGWLRVAGEFEDPPSTSTINWSDDGQTIANMAIVGVEAPAAGIVVQGGGSGRTHLVIDVVGFLA